MAVAPPTWTWSCVLRVAAGSTSSRRRETRSVVAWSCGEVRGTTVSVAASRCGESRGRETKATPGSRATVRRTSASAAVESPSRGNEDASTSGPLKPGPKPSASRS